MSSSSPFEIFNVWFSEAKEHESSYPEAFTLSTVSKKGQPSSRTLLLRGFSDTHYTFFTNYNSKKGSELKEIAKASMLFYWKSTKKQIRIEGTCTYSSKEVSDNYWKNRPYESRLHAFVSKQSEVLQIDQSKVNSLFKQVRTDYPLDIPRPLNWGGFDLKPHYFEFWEEGDFRWHKRLSFSLDGDNWRTERLYP
jgi:pyridoxamine 5'-phosphate oxidase